jgi:hypothetical protein
MCKIFNLTFEVLRTSKVFSVIFLIFILMNKWHCLDCSVNTRKNPKDFYMVHAHIWDQYGVGEGMLCMDCFEKRLGRKLKADDILPSVLTIRDNPYTRELLLGI